MINKMSILEPIDKSMYTTSPPFISMTKKFHPSKASYIPKRFAKVFLVDSVYNSERDRKPFTRQAVQRSALNEALRIKSVNAVSKTSRLQGEDRSTTPLEPLMRRKLPLVDIKQVKLHQLLKEFPIEEPKETRYFVPKARSLHKDDSEFFTDTEQSNFDPHQTPLLLKSVYQNRPATVFFNYLPNFFAMEKPLLRIKPSYGQKFRFKIADTCVYPLILQTMDAAGFKRTEENDFNVHIGGIIGVKFLKELRPYQKVNRFPGSRNIGRKDSLWKLIHRMQKRYPDKYDFCPLSFVMPEDSKKLQTEIEDNPDTIWIKKPMNSACGKGIKISDNHIKYSGPCIISRYISNPHLINGLKYDIRLYVCVTSFAPLRAYIYKEGLVRFATAPYSNERQNLNKKFSHLTNYSINKASPSFVPNTDVNEDGVGSKWSLSALLDYIGDSAKPLMDDIHDIIIKTLIAVEPHIVSKLNRSGVRRGTCFELYGFDVLVDSNMKPWMLEVNIFPSLSATSPLDTKVKGMLLTDLYNLVGIFPLHRAKDRRSFDFRGRKQESQDLCYDDALLVVEGEEENYRRGNFKRIFPLSSNVSTYTDLFDVCRHCNDIVWRFLKNKNLTLKHYFKKLRNPISI